MNIVKSPLNYTGGKSKLFPQIQALIPEKFEVFYDIFSGGANIGINVNAKEIYCVDNNEALIKLIQYIQNSSYHELIQLIDDKINSYQLSNTFKNGYEFYHCNSSNGLANYNKIGFKQLKEDYNQTKDNLLFLLLIIFGFNNQIRFNKKGEFNLPVGKRDFNANLRKKLKLFMEQLSKNITFLCKDFRSLDIKELGHQKAFLYLDPPYILGNASYNENGGWMEADEIDLLNWLEKCHDNNIQFALSNVIEHKGKTHKLLLDWCLSNSFTIHQLNYHYKNSNYQIHFNENKQYETKEVLITNY